MKRQLIFVIALLLMTVITAISYAESPEVDNAAEMPVLAFAAPSGLTSTPISSGSIVLGWTDSNTGETGYQVQRKSGACSSSNVWNLVKTTAANAATYTDTGLSADTQYAYRVRATDGSTYSAYSKCSGARTGLAGTPEAPAGLKALSLSLNAVNLTWTHTGSNISGFRVFRRTGTGTWQLIKETAPSARSYRDTAAAGNSSSAGYAYYVKAFNAAGPSPATNTAAVPFIPTSLLAVRALEGVNLTWQDNSTNETGAQVQRREGTCSAGGTWALVSTTLVNATQYNDKNAAGPVAFRIRSMAKSAGRPYSYGYSMYSNCAEIDAGGQVQLPETGQKTCYNDAGIAVSCSGTGQDGALKKGIAWPATRFVSGTGTEIDCVTDKLTGLMWPKNGNLAGTAKTWTDALSYANSFSYCGHADWRLPNRNELLSLVNREEPDTITWLNTYGFNHIQTGGYWSSTTAAYGTNYAWYVNIWDGFMDGYYKGFSSPGYYAWPVRAGQGGNSVIDLPETGQKTCYDETGNSVICAYTGQDGELRMGFAWPVTRFVAGTGAEADCMTDALTGLMWPRNGNLAGAVKTWKAALTYANDLSLCGYTDWRLPNINEISSLQNAAEPEQSTWLNTHGFNNVVTGFYWSSTSSADFTDNAWGTLFWSGKISYFPKTNSAYVIPVRAGQ